MSSGGQKGLSPDAAGEPRIERREERARVYRIVAQNRHARLTRGAATWLLRGDFLAIATVEYPVLLESLKADVMSVIEELKGRAGRMDLEARAILEREPVRAALEAWWSKAGIRAPWLDQIVMDTLGAWVLGGVPGNHTAGFEQWVIEPHVTDEPPGMGADLDEFDELGPLRLELFGENKREFLARASKHYDSAQEILRRHRILDPMVLRDRGVSRLARLRMVAHRRVGRRSPRDAWELVCLEEPCSDDGEITARKQRDYTVDVQKQNWRLCTEVEYLLDLPDLPTPLQVHRSPAPVN